MDIEINWARLNRALEFYKQKGYVYKEVPWIVPSFATEATRPKEVEPIEIYEGVNVSGYGGKTLGELVGSAEQSFIYKLETEGIEEGDYCALTPCFRPEKNNTNLIRPYFMKVELFSNHPDTSLTSIINDCVDFFNSEIENSQVEKIETDEGYDLTLNGIEVGSYGVRNWKNFEWLYATGLAEPRFNEALKQKEK